MNWDDIEILDRIIYLTDPSKEEKSVGIVLGKAEVSYSLFVETPDGPKRAIETQKVLSVQIEGGIQPDGSITPPSTRLRAGALLVSGNAGIGRLGGLLTSAEGGNIILGKGDMMTSHTSLSEEQQNLFLTKIEETIKKGIGNGPKNS